MLLDLANGYVLAPVRDGVVYEGNQVVSSNSRSKCFV